LRLRQESGRKVSGQAELHSKILASLISREKKIRVKAEDFLTTLIDWNFLFSGKTALFCHLPVFLKFQFDYVA
jgi:hypothetical protein